MVLARRRKQSFPKLFSGGHLFVFVEYLCKRSPKIKTKNIKNCSSILAIVNHRNWRDDSPPLSLRVSSLAKIKIKYVLAAQFSLAFKAFQRSVSFASNKQHFQNSYYHSYVYFRLDQLPLGSVLSDSFFL